MSVRGLVRGTIGIMAAAPAAPAARTLAGSVSCAIRALVTLTVVVVGTTLLGAVKALVAICWPRCTQTVGGCALKPTLGGFDRGGRLYKH